MKYKIRHLTQYTYSDSVPLCHNHVRLAPRKLPYQTVDSFDLLVDPEPAEQSCRVDNFGNQVSSFSIQTPHAGLSITALSSLTVTDRPNEVQDPGLPWTQLIERTKAGRSGLFLDAYQFAFASPYVPLKRGLADYASESFTAGRDVAEAAIELTSRIYHDFEYDPRATTVSTPVQEVFRERKGVCQDFAHLQIACLRSIGIPAKYVSGYLRTIPPPGQPRLVGADASHAWVAVFVGEKGWLELDPTNDAIPGRDYVTIGWGRDYGDVCPVQGVFIGGGQHELSISVDVAPATENA